MSEPMTEREAAFAATVVQLEALPRSHMWNRAH
jgi:hypothetical protein